MSRACPSVTPRLGIAVLGSIDCGTVIHCTRNLLVLGTLTSDVHAPGELRERRTDAPVGSAHPRNHVTGAAAVGGDLQFVPIGATAGHGASVGIALKAALLPGNRLDECRIDTAARLVERSKT